MSNEDEDTEFRKSLEEEAKMYGNEFVHNKLKDVDEVSFEEVFHLLLP